MSIEVRLPFASSAVRAVHHLCLPSHGCDWQKTRQFWESLGLICRVQEIKDPSYDHAGAGLRLQVFAGHHQLVVSYFQINLPHYMIVRVLSYTHLALELAPPALASARAHPAFERETHWGHSNTSVFLRGPQGLHVELVTTNPEFHRELTS